MRKDKNRVRKSFKTRSFEKLANSGTRNANRQEALYKATGNPYNKKSAEQWRMESALNKKNAQESYRYDILKSKTPRKERYSKRKVSKGIRELGTTSPEVSKLDKKFSKELSNTKEGKAYRNTLHNMAALEKAARERGGRMVYSQEQANSINKVFADYQKKGKEVYESKYREKAASAYLKDLGYKDTEYGRAYLKRHGFV